MPLQYPSEWLFEGCGVSIPNRAFQDFFELLKKIAARGSKKWSLLEAFKSEFGAEARSSSIDWAEGDLRSAMSDQQSNAAAFIDSLWRCVERAEEMDAMSPGYQLINSILKKHSVPFVIEDGELIKTTGDVLVSDSPTAVLERDSHPVYQKIGELGRGGYGTVYRVVRTTAVGKFEFAMKVFSPSSFIEDRERALKRFALEISTLSNLQHRGIISTIEAGIDASDSPYHLMPVVEGMQIRDALSGASPDRVARVFDEVLCALEYAHANNVLHRDIKSSNILVRESDDQPVILDFGCSYREREDGQSLTTSMVGTPAYIPPEVIANHKLRTPGQDIYACGILLYEIVGEMTPDVTDYQPLEPHDRGFTGVDDLIQAAIASQKLRIPSMIEFRRRLADCQW